MYRFNKSRRLLQKKEFDEVFKGATRLSTPEFIVLFCENTQKHARLGLVLSKKVVHKAHDRNRIKRILRESFRINQHLPAVDVVILARPAVNNAMPYEIRANLGKLWNVLSAPHAP